MRQGGTQSPCRPYHHEAELDVPFCMILSGAYTALMRQDAMAQPRCPQHHAAMSLCVVALLEGLDTLVGALNPAGSGLASHASWLCRKQAAPSVLSLHEQLWECGLTWPKAIGA